MLQLGGLAATIDALQHHEAAWGGTDGPGAILPRRLPFPRIAQRHTLGHQALRPLHPVHPRRSTLLAEPSCSRRAFTTTVIELRAINNAARGGERRMPKPGSSAPAAIGSTMRL